MRAPLAPVEADASEAPPFPFELCHVDVEPGKPGRACRHHRVGLASTGEQVPLHERFGEGDAELAGKVVVAGARSLERACGLGSSEIAGNARRCDTSKRLERFRQLRTREPEEAVAAADLVARTTRPRASGVSPSGLSSRRPTRRRRTRRAA
jgi:hypothetical protein